MTNTWRAYKNGNYMVRINLADGTKIRSNNEDFFIADRPESIDINISNRCEQGCKFCYQKCTSEGDIADFDSPLFDSIPPYTEIALNGNGIWNWPSFDQFLMKMANKKVICNLTVHVRDFIKYYHELRYFIEHELVHGVGVSVNESVDEKTISYLKSLPNVIVHVVAGIVPWETLVKLSNNGLKLLILGYKEYGRGETYIKNHDVRANIATLKDRIGYLYKHFKVVSFDNLALEQLDIKNTVSEELWNLSYMGEDGSATFFIDMVARTYAKSSISPRHPIDVNDVTTLFRRVRDGEV